MWTVTIVFPMLELRTPSALGANSNTRRGQQQQITDNQGPGTAIETTSNPVEVLSLDRAIFIGRLNIKTCEGYQQVLEIKFERTITADTSDLQQVANTIITYEIRQCNNSAYDCRKKCQRSSGKRHRWRRSPTSQRGTKRPQQREITAPS
jgi:hypothetical protein